eukprot:scaffold72131_cov22-Tisochrysis_lutea.AAC.1
MQCNHPAGSGLCDSCCVLLQATNKLLQEEKVSREALLSRQFDLLACLEQSTRPTKKLSVSKLSHGQLNTLGECACLCWNMHSAKPKVNLFPPGFLHGCIQALPDPPPQQCHYVIHAFCMHGSLNARVIR